MTGQQLKNSILQMAIQGKLVPQDPHDEPASVLLERIREEKKRLVKEGVLKKKDLAEKDISEEEIPFDIPEGWEWCRINSILSLQAGKNVTAADINEERNSVFQYPCYGGNGLRGFVKSFNTEGTYPLIGRQGALCGNVNMAESKFWATEHAVVVDGFNMTNVKWQYYALKALNLNRYATATAQPGLAVSRINDVLLPLPPLVEQRRIVEKLESLMPLIESYGKSQEALNALNASLPEKLRQSILQEAIQGHLVPQDPNEEPASVLLERIRAEKARLVKEGKLKKKDLEEKPISPDEIPFDIPEGWVWCRLSNILQICTGKKDANFGDEKGIYDFFTCSNTPLKSNSYSYDGEYLIMPGNGANIGQVVHYIGKFEAYQRTYLLKPYSSLNLDYVKYHLLTNWKEYNQDKLYGSAIPYIKLENLTSYLVAFPPLSEQRRIVTKLEELLQEIDKLKV